MGDIEDDEVDVKVEAAPPSSHPMVVGAQNLVDTMTAAHNEATQNMRASLRDLHLHKHKVGVKNTSKADAAKELTRAVLVATQSKKAAVAAKEKVDLLVQICDDLFSN